MFDKYNIELELTRDQLGTNPCDPNVMDNHVIQRQRNLILEKSKINTEINKYLDAIPIAKEKGDEEVDKIMDKLEKLTGMEFNEADRKAAVAGELDSLKETFKELQTAGTTVFFWDNEKDKPCIGDHMIYGFLKAAAETIGRTLTKKRGVVLHSTSFTQALINQHIKCEEQFLSFDRTIKEDDKGNPVYLQRSLRAMTAKGPRISLAKSEVVPAGAKLNFTLKVMKNSPLNQKTIEKLFSIGELTGLGQWRNAGWGQFKYKLTVH